MIKDICEAAGWRVDEEYGWILQMQPCKARMLNNNDQRKANEDNMILRDTFLPVKDYNFKYALYQCGGIIEKAIEYAKEKLIVNGKPIWLPDEFKKKYEQLHPMDDAPKYTYASILRGVENNTLNISLPKRVQPQTRDAIKEFTNKLL